MAKKFNFKYCVALPIVLIITIFLWAVPVSFFGIEALTVVQQRVIALFVFAALMWIFEIIPNWSTSLLVIVISLLTVSNKGIGLFCDPQYGTLVPYARIMSSMADPVVMLFLGGFVLAIMAERYGLDVTLARALLKLFGTKPEVVLLGFLLMISVFSMFMSNTATAAMMLALLTPVLSKLPADDKGKVGLALSIPVAANLGGIGTPIGTPPNATAKGALEQAGIDVSFGEWCVHMIPYVLIMILIAWVLLRFFFPFKTKKLVLEIPESKQKKDWRLYVVWITFVGTILLWATEQITHINSNIVALIPLGVFTATGLFGKEEIKEINWNVLWLVAGGFCLGYCLQDTGLAKVLIQAIPFGSMKRPGVLPAFQLHLQFRHRRAAHPDPHRGCERHGRPRGRQQRAVPRHGRYQRHDHLHCRVRLHRDAFPDFHAAECHRLRDRHGGDQGYDQGRSHHRLHRFHLRLLLAYQDFPVLIILT